MSSTNDIDNTPKKSSVFNFTVHLPGLKKTEQIVYNKTLINTTELFYFMTDSFGVVPRRAGLYLILPNELPISVNEFSLAFHNISIKDGDTFILCVRETTVTGENEYYENQKESLEKNKYLNPSISKESAISLLVDIANNFELCGHKHFLPGGRWYEYKKIVKKKVSPYYCEKAKSEECN